MAIKNTIVSRQSPTHIVKVKSHVGIIGNEIADQIATGVAKGEIRPDLEVIEPSNDRANEYWLHLAQRNNSKQQHTNPPPDPLPDLDNHLKKQCHQRHRLGTANQNTIYFSATTKMNSRLNAQASRKFMTMQTITERERTNVIKLLNGNLYTNKLAKRYGHQPTDKCPLCKQPDGGYHLAGGCPQLTESYLARHHAAGMYILAAIQAGSKGGTIIQADVGNHNKQKATGITPLPSRIPNDHLPTNHDPTATSVPDMTLYEKIKRGRIIKRRYTIVEIKYCTDTRPEPQQTHADLQHTGLISSLTKSRYNTEARLVTIVLGMAGYIYQEETEEQLKRLGISGQALNSLTTNLHIQAVKSLTRIIQARRKQEKQQWRKKMRLSQKAGHTQRWHQIISTTSQHRTGSHSNKHTTITKRKQCHKQPKTVVRNLRPRKKHKTGIG
jgi:hypothetical protein